VLGFVVLKNSDVTSGLCRRGGEVREWGVCVGGVVLERRGGQR